MIKKLIWEDTEDFSTAHTPIGEYSVEKDLYYTSPHWYVFDYRDDRIQCCDTREKAKSLAEYFYTSLINSCLEKDCSHD